MRLQIVDDRPAAASHTHTPLPGVPGFRPESDPTLTAATPVEAEPDADDGTDDDAGEIVEEVETVVEDEAIADDRANLKRWVMMIEGPPTGDGRTFEEGSIEWRDVESTPMPLMATDTTSEFHMGARLVGHFVDVTREPREGGGNNIIGFSRFIESDDAEVLNLQAMIERGDLPWISVDCENAEGVYEVPMGDEATEGAEVVAIPFGGDADPRARFTKARLIGATAVPMQAFMEARQEDLVASLMTGQFSVMRHGLIAAGDDPHTGVVVVANPADAASFAVDGGLPAEELHVTLAYYGSIDEVTPETLAAADEWAVAHADAAFEARVGGVARMGNDDPQAVVLLLEAPEFQSLHDDLIALAPNESDHPHFVPHMTLGYGLDINTIEQPDSVSIAGVTLWAGESRKGTPDADDAEIDEEVAEGDDLDEALIASIKPPVEPPLAWFDDPKLSGPTEFTVTDEGEMWGHVATFDSCHIGFTNECVTAPRSKTAYAAFLTGELVTAEGERVKVGQITVNSGHADMAASPRLAKEHYDHTGWAAADVACGEDEFGIWVHGAVRPHLSGAQMREFMAAPPSGDWRKINGNLEMVGVAAVNVPGFMTTMHSRARVASGAVTTLIASAVKPCARPAAEQAVADRIAASIGRHPIQLAAQRDAIAARLGRDPESRKAALLARVRR